MQPLRIAGATRRLAEDQDEYFALSIKDDIIDGQPVMISAWEPTPAEAADIAGGGAIVVSILTAMGETFTAFLKQPPEEQRQALACGGSCILAVPGKRHPPVLMTTVSKDAFRKMTGPDAPSVAVGVRRAPELA